MRRGVLIFLVIADLPASYLVFPDDGIFFRVATPSPPLGADVQSYLAHFIIRPTGYHRLNVGWYKEVTPVNFIRPPGYVG